MDEYAPPLPLEVISVLSRASLAYLATVEDGLPHLSLMSYTHTEDPELGPVLVLTTRKDTKKFRALQTTSSVAVLIHDFDSVRRDGETQDAIAPGSLSVTVYGETSVTNGEVAERLRAVHLARNPKYPQFICGDNIAVIAVRPTLARMCNIQDVVTTWSNPKGRPLRSSSFGSDYGTPTSPIATNPHSSAVAASAVAVLHEDGRR